MKIILHEASTGEAVEALILAAGKGEIALVVHRNEERN